MAYPRDWDARTIKVDIDGAEVEDIESIGFNSEDKDEPIVTIKALVGWLSTHTRYTGSIIVKATCEKLDTLIEAQEGHTNVTISIDYADNGVYESSTFSNARFKSYKPSGFKIDETPTMTFDFEALSAVHTKKA